MPVGAATVNTRREHPGELTFLLQKKRCVIDLLDDM